jgi:hypothetical protein
MTLAIRSRRGDGCKCRGWERPGALGVNGFSYTRFGGDSHVKFQNENREDSLEGGNPASSLNSLFTEYYSGSHKSGTSHAINSLNFGPYGLVSGTKR